ncbi:MAG: STAS domain-containing protein [Lentisphaeria bacterium]|nr:STAS domain-containing protein [Lentisphaeria bacterium]
MRDTDLLISSRNGVYYVTVTGRANFEYAVPLRDIAKSSNTAGGIVIDLGSCTAMDSTFMGVLTMLALKNRNSAPVELCNAGPVLQKLLRDLGVAKLFVFKEQAPVENAGAVQQAPSPLTTAETVSEAHKALADADDANREKFRAVIEYADKDVARLKKEENQ